MARELATAAALWLSATACGSGDPTAPLPSGTVQFTLAGAVTGAFSVTGALDSFNATSAGAAGWFFAPVSPGTPGFYQVQALRAQAGATSDELRISFWAVSAPGTYTLCPDGDPPAGGCVQVGSYFPSGGVIYYFADVTVNITRLDQERLEATFSGHLENGGAAVTLSAGVIDVPIREP